VAEGVDDPAEPPAMLIGDRGEFFCAGDYSFPDDCIWVVHNEQGPASRSTHYARAEPLQLTRDRSDPERSVAHLELGHDVITLTNTVNDDRAERSRIESQRLAWTLNP
jgi:hypothetical protein